jgi:DNA-directed RNA polymerase specialized sigma24 family protein
VAFWRGAARGDLPDELNRDNLWRLLAVITVRKARKHVERQRTKKRGGGKVVGEDVLANPGLRLDQLAQELPAQEFDLQCEELLLMLDDELRRIALLRLMGHTTREIADQLDCTQRKVQRKLNLIELRWRQDAETA